MPKAELFTIGEFSAMTGVGIHSLRYYDEIGALKPEYVDPVSNYRYYGLRQLSLIPAINMCKDAGISLSNFDSYLVDGSVDYKRLLDESQKSLEHKIESYRMKQKEIEEIGMLLAVERTIKEKDEFRTHLDNLSVRVMPVSEDPRGDSTGTLRKLSAEARRHGQHITASVCGLMQTKESDNVSLCAFSQVSADSDEPAYRTQLMAIPAGEYLIKRTDAFGIHDAVQCFAGVSEAANSATILSLAFICNEPEPVYCAAAKLS